MPQMTPQQVAKSKKRIKNPGGSVSTERSMTIGTDKGYVNIPTIKGGKQLSKQGAIRAWRTSGEGSKPFKTQDAAISAAKARSAAIGKSLNQDRQFYGHMNPKTAGKKCNIIGGQ